MKATAAIRGTVVEFERPQWEPLARIVGHDLVGWFMWMFEIELANESRLHAYKHVTTRRYMHVDATGRAFQYDAAGRYQEVAVPVAIARVFVGWEQSSPADHDAAALRAAMWRARAAA